MALETSADAALSGTIAEVKLETELEEDISYAPRFERGERTAAIDRLTAEHTTRKAKQR